MYTLRTLPNTIKIVKRNTSGIIGIVSNYKCLEKILYRSKKEIRGIDNRGHNVKQTRQLIKELQVQMFRDYVKKRIDVRTTSSK